MNAKKSFFKSFLSKGIQNRQSSVFIEVIPVLSIEPKAVTRNAGKFSLLINN